MQTEMRAPCIAVAGDGRQTDVVRLAFRPEAVNLLRDLGDLDVLRVTCGVSGGTGG
jgi:hypothetical protein